MPGQPVIILRTTKNKTAKLYAGDSRNDDFEFTVKQDGVVVDITSWVIEAVLKPTIEDADTAAITTPTKLTGALSDPSNGKFTLPFSTTTITTTKHQAFLVIWRLLSAKKQIKAQFLVEVLPSGTD